MPPLYSKINKDRGRIKPSAATNSAYDGRPELPEKKRNRQQPVAPRRPAPRVEHDFSPTVSAEQHVDSDSNSSTDDDMPAGREGGAPSQPAGDELSSEDEDTYACMEGFADSVIGDMVRSSIIDSAVVDDDDDDDRYVETPFTRQSDNRDSEPDTPVQEVGEERPLTPPASPPPPSSPPPPAPSNQPKPTPSIAVIDQSAIDDNIYENSKTVKDEGRVKAMPTAAPRRARTVNAAPAAVMRLKASEPPVPQKRGSLGSAQLSRADSEPEQEDYENALGLFGTGVTPDIKSKPEHDIKTLPAKTSPSKISNRSDKMAKSVKTSRTRSPPISRLKAAQSIDADADMPPLPPLPTPPNNNHQPKSIKSESMQPGAAKPAEKTNNNRTVVVNSDIPLADGESSDDLSSPGSTRSSNHITNQAHAAARLVSATISLEQ